jgi:uncharacterized protein
VITTSPHHTMNANDVKGLSMLDARPLQLLDDKDLLWIEQVLDILVACRGQPWRVALERLDGLHPTAVSRVPPGVPEPPPSPVGRQKLAAVIRAIQRVVGRHTQSDLAKTCRALVLGRPALAPSERLDRIAAAARSLELSIEAVEQLLWVDLPRERPIELPQGRPDELEIAAFANVQLVENVLRRSHNVQLKVRGDAGPLLRAAARCGLLTTAKTTTAATIDATETIIDIVGPLALFHRTAVYGRALAALIPLLSDVEAFELTIRASGFNGDYAVQLTSPALLPRTPAALHAPSKQVARLAREVGALRPEVSVVIGPPAIVADGVYLCPDLRIDQTYVELVGFWTGEYLARKRGAYEAAGLQVVFCVDELRGCAEEELPADVLGYGKAVKAAELLRRIA